MLDPDHPDYDPRYIPVVVAMAEGRALTPPAPAPAPADAAARRAAKPRVALGVNQRRH